MRAAALVLSGKVVFTLPLSSRRPLNHAHACSSKRKMMVYKFGPALLTVAISAISSTSSRSRMQAKDILEKLEKKELGSYFSFSFNEDPGRTLHDEMYAGQNPEDWIRASTQVGVFLAKFRQAGVKSNIKDSSASLIGTSSLYEWLRSLNTQESIMNIIPERMRSAYGSSMDKFQRRASEAIKLLERQDHVCLQNVLAKNVKLQSSQIKINGNGINARFGPDSLDAALFVADLFMMYYKQTGVIEHGDQWKTVESAQLFGQSMEQELGRLGVASEDDMKRFWSDVSLLTGWEAVRRYVTKDNVDEILARPEHDPAAVTECGIRLIFNENVKNPNFMVNIALALLH